MEPTFHPLVARWFAGRFRAPTKPQEAGWPEIAAGRDTLIAAPTGSGKTLAAFLWAIDTLIKRAEAGHLDDETAVVYVSPLKALGNDIQKNLQEPLAEIRALAAAEGIELPEIRVVVRSGDTPTSERERMIRRPPHILITTPESLFILLTAERSRQFLRTARTVIVDEIHAVAGDKRGAHLALSLERLDRLAGTPLQRIGLSATQKPIQDVARLLVGWGRQRPDGSPACRIVDEGHRRRWDLSIEVPDQPLGPIASHELRAEIYDRIAELVRAHRTTLVFVNTRRLAERVSHQLTERLGEGKVAAHHGSLSKKIRLQAEEGLKSGEVPVVVATASLELGIDIGHVDLVCHLGAPRAFATLVQRVGRSGHGVETIPKGILFPLTRDELFQSAAAVRAVRDGELDRVIFPRKPIDILAQQVTAITAAEEIGEQELWELIRRGFHYGDLTRDEFEPVLEMLSEGVATRTGRRSAHVHRDRVNAILRGRRGARLAAITSGGAIPDTGDYDVIEEPAGTFVGRVNEDFAIESLAGDVFLLGNASWRIRRVESGRVLVEDAHGAPPTIPFWLGEAPARTDELSAAVSELRREIEERLDDRPGTVRWLVETTGVDGSGAEQIIDYVAETVAALGCVPTLERVVAERFFDEAGGMQLVLHAPFGARINRAWGLALRKKFCLTFDFELQAAATDDGIVLSLSEHHSFPLESIFAYLKTATLEDTLVQALLPAPMFTNRWRWNATRALALLRHAGGRKVPLPIQRMRSEDLLASVFPEQVQCQDNRAGPITPPDHPLVNETIANCLHEAMDLDGLERIVSALEEGRLEFRSVETPAPSAMSQEILNANPYAFLDDAPLEERRARAVALRRTDPELAKGLGALDPQAIAEVLEQARPSVRDADELHDLLLTVGLLPVDETEGWEGFATELVAARRAAVASWFSPGVVRKAYVAAERLHLLRAALPDASLDPKIESPVETAPPETDEAAKVIVQGWMEQAGPTTVGRLAERLGLTPDATDRALLALEGSGAVLRGSFTGTTDEVEWCDRRLLARIHRTTVGRLRREIEPVPAADLVRFLLRWQRVQPGTQLHGREGVARIVEQLQGLELPAPAWEEHVLPARVRNYSPGDLEDLCLSGVVTWGKLSVNGRAEEAAEADEDRPRTKGQRPARSTPIAFVLREDLPVFLEPRGEGIPGLGGAAGDVAGYLQGHGASFLADIATGTGRMPAEVEKALWQLVSVGLVTGDGIAGLRTLLRGPEERRRRATRLRAVPAHRVRRHLPLGRWSLWGPVGEPRDETERNETIAEQLLARYGVVLRELLARERIAPSWRELLAIYRRWEAQGRIRGGRFVSGFVGDQFALPEAVEALRAVRRAPEESEPVIVSAADPLNLVGIILPGDRVSPLSGLAIAYRNGVAEEIGPLGAIRSRLGRANAQTP